jgi:hypothetical protein
MAGERHMQLLLFRILELVSKASDMAEDFPSLKQAGLGP